MKEFAGRTVVVTGAASGFGLETCRIAAGLGMNLVMADVEAVALAEAEAEMSATGAVVLARRVDVARGAEVEALGAAVVERFGAPHLVFNNAGVGAGGLVWETSEADWNWVLGVNVMGVAHGVRVFVPLMLEAAARDANYEGHVVNTASMAGLLAPPNMGVYNVSKHAVVALSETLYQDLRLVTEQVSASVLCPFFVPTGIVDSDRNRPAGEVAAEPTKSQLIGRAMTGKAVGGGKVTAADVARLVFEAVAADRFYIYSHPKALASVQTRLEDVIQARNPTDPFAGKPEIGADLRRALRSLD